MTTQAATDGGRFRYVILGAGAAGLSLCLALLARGVHDPILILDPRTAFPDDRTWCFWDVRPTPFSDLARHCWHRWEVVDGSGAAALQESRGVGYLQLRAADFYARALDAIRRPDVTLALGRAAGRVQTCPDGVRVQSGGDTYAADYAFDSRPRPAPGPAGVALSQRFLGQFVQAEEPAFDPARATLMDFRACQGRGLHFFYVLPFSPTHALVENTYVQAEAAAPPTPAEHRAEIAAYLREARGLSGFRVEREEHGAIPMTDAPFPRRDGRVVLIGTAGGCTKPSSGYTFLRIQEQCRQLADAAASGALDRFRERRAPRRFRFFDAVFLRAMRDRPQDFPGHFHRLFSRVPPEALTAFLSETSTWRDDFQILRSLPPAPVLRAALRSLTPRTGRGRSGGSASG